MAGGASLAPGDGPPVSVTQLRPPQKRPQPRDFQRMLPTCSSWPRKAWAILERPGARPQHALGLHTYFMSGGHSVSRSAARRWGKPEVGLAAASTGSRRSCLHRPGPVVLRCVREIERSKEIRTRLWLQRRTAIYCFTKSSNFIYRVSDSVFAKTT